jgi:hypothetical protein
VEGSADRAAREAAAVKTAITRKGGGGDGNHVCDQEGQEEVRRYEDMQVDVQVHVRALEQGSESKNGRGGGDAHEVVVGCGRCGVVDDSLPMEVTEEMTLPEGAVQEGANVEAVTKAGEEVMGTKEGEERALTEAGEEGAVKKAGEEEKKGKGAESWEQGKKMGKVATDATTPARGEGHAETAVQNKLPGSMSSTVRKVSARRPMPSAVCSREGALSLSLSCSLMHASISLSRSLAHACKTRAYAQADRLNNLCNLGIKRPAPPGTNSQKVLSIVTVNSEC